MLIGHLPDEGKGFRGFRFDAERDVIVIFLLDVPINQIIVIYCLHNRQSVALLFLRCRVPKMAVEPANLLIVIIFWWFRFRFPAPSFDVRNQFHITAPSSIQIYMYVHDTE